MIRFKTRENDMKKALIVKCRGAVAVGLTEKRKRNFEGGIDSFVDFFL